MRGIHKVSFPLVPQLVNHLLVKRLHVHDRVMTLHDVCTNGTSRVLTVASLQQFKMEALIPVPADCEVRSMIKFLKNKRRGMLSAGVVLLHDNVRPQTARRSTPPAGVRLEGV